MKHLLVIFVLIILASCYKEVDIDLPNTTPIIVIGSYFTANEYIDVSITKTQPTNDTLYAIEQEVKAWIETNGKIHVLSKINKTLYRSPIKANTKQGYSIKVSGEAFDTVTSTDTVPAFTSFKINRYIPTAYVDNEGYNYSAFQITLEDIPPTKTYYELRMKAECAAGKSTVYRFIDLVSNDIIVRNEGLVNLTYSKIGLLFSNELISVPNRSLTFNFDNMIDDDYNKILNVKIQLRTVSDAYFNYKKKLYLNIENQAGDIWDGTGNPVESYTNINNGYGIFAAYSQTTQIYILP